MDRRIILLVACWCALSLSKAVPVKKSIDASSSSSKSSNDLYKKLVSDLQDVLADKVKRSDSSRTEKLLSGIKNLLTNQKRGMKSSDDRSPGLRWQYDAPQHGLTWGSDHSQNGLTWDSPGLTWSNDNAIPHGSGLTWRKRTDDLLDQLQDILRRREGPLRSWRLGASARGGKRELSRKLHLILKNKKDELPAKKESGDLFNSLSYTNGLSKKNDETPKRSTSTIYKRLVNDLNDLLSLTKNDDSLGEKNGAILNDDLSELTDTGSH